MKVGVIYTAKSELEFFSSDLGVIPEKNILFFSVSDVNFRRISYCSIILLSAEISWDGDNRKVFNKLFFSGKKKLCFTFEFKKDNKFILRLIPPARQILFYHNMISFGDDTHIRMTARTFGLFDVYVDNKVIEFRNSKAKELLALCIDRCGETVSAKEAGEMLWEERVYDDNVSQLYRKAARELTRSLEQANVPELFVRGHGKCRINHKLIKCDYYTYLKGPELICPDPESYLQEYVWAKKTRKAIFNKIHGIMDPEDKN